MIRNFIFLVLCALGVAAMGQGRVPVTYGQAAQKFPAHQAEQTMFLGEYGIYQCLVIPQVSARGKMGDIQVALTDGDLRVHRRIAISNTKNMRLLSARLNDGIVSLLFIDESNRKHASIWSALVNLDMMQLVSSSDLNHPLPTGLTEVYRNDVNRKDKLYAWGASSKNGAYAGLVLVSENEDKGEYTAVEVCFDGLMNRVWEHNSALGTISTIAVTNEGDIYTFGHDVAEDGSTQFTVCEITSAGASKYLFSGRMDQVIRAEILNVEGDRVVAGGIMRSEHSPRKSDWCSGVFGLAFDKRTKALAGNIGMRPFQNEDVCMMTNKSTKKNLKQDYIKEEVETLGYVPTAWGGAMAIGATETRNSVDADGIATESKYCIGIHVFGVDTTGAILWARNIRRNDYQMLDDVYLDALLLSSGDDVALLKCENMKYPSDYNITKPAKKMRIGEKNNLVFYRITSSGDVNKIVLATKQKQMLVGRPYPKADGAWWFLANWDEQTRIGDIRF
ncbi:MAG: hypothetical protein K6F85_05030 [Bacteroidales bacterium]|nr:hypothetical protein [Bacteroidales bacterium]